MKVIFEHWQRKTENVGKIFSVDVDLLREFLRDQLGDTRELTDEEVINEVNNNYNDFFQTIYEKEIPLEVVHSWDPEDSFFTHTSKEDMKNNIEWRAWFSTDTMNVVGEMAQDKFIESIPEVKDIESLGTW